MTCSTPVVLETSRCCYGHVCSNADAVNAARARFRDQSLAASIIDCVGVY